MGRARVEGLILEMTKACKHWARSYESQQLAREWARRIDALESRVAELEAELGTTIETVGQEIAELEADQGAERPLRRSDIDQLRQEAAAHPGVLTIEARDRGHGYEEIVEVFIDGFRIPNMLSATLSGGHGELSSASIGFRPSRVIRKLVQD